MNKIDWTRYADHIFCIHYLPNNRFEKISDTLRNINVDIDSSFFSFIYDIEHKVFHNEEMIMMANSFAMYNSLSSTVNGQRLRVYKEAYTYYLGRCLYKALKIAQHFNYERIIIFEDDIIFLKDIEYIIDSMEFLKNQIFDIAICQTTFRAAWHGIASYMIENNRCQKLDHENFLRTESRLGVYGGSFLILSKECINKIVNFFEENNMVVCLDVLDTLRSMIGLNTIFALKPLCIQEHMTHWDEEKVKDENINMVLSNYI